MNETGLRPRSLAVVVGLAVGASALVVAGLIREGFGRPDRVGLAAFFLVATALVVLFPIDFAFKTKLHLDTAVIVAAVMLFPLGEATAILGVGVLVGYALRPGSRDLAQAAFNAGQVVLQAGTASLLFTAAGWNTAQPLFDYWLLVWLVPLAGVAMYGVSLLAVATMVASEESLPLVPTWRLMLIEDPRAEALFQISLLMIGVLAAMVAVTHPWGLVLLAAPLAGTYVALRHHIRMRRDAEAARHGSDATLREAQRIAHVGSWEWDLDSDRQRWSDETYRIFGFPPQSFAPGREVFTRCLHHDDRSGVMAAIDETIGGGSAFSVEHRALRADGTERVVHQRGEIVAALTGRPKRLVGTVHDITDQKWLEARLAHLAFHDALTGLPNRAFFMDRLSRALRPPNVAPPGPILPLLFLDLDGFKLVNDGFGHESGDRLLVEAGQRLRGELAPADTLARLGGDEFAILLSGTRDLDQAQRTAERLIGAMRRPFSVGPHETFVTVSVGVAAGVPGESDPIDLLRQADIALYQAKALGRGMVSRFEPAMQAMVMVRVEREAALRQALERDELRLHYQPQVDLATGRVVAVEALVRWQHPEQGMLPPEEFIRLAEETGLILPLGRWVLEEACRRARRWQRRLPGVLVPVGVNLSARQFRDPNLVPEIAAVLRATNLDPRFLELEVTESVAMTDAATTRTTLDALRALGVAVAVDDFGTGYSSLGRLRELRPNALKLDRSFVAQFGENDGSHAIVRAVVSLAGELGLTVTAEGIETAEQASLLCQLGMVRGQGFYFSRPLEWDAVDELLTNDTRLPMPGVATMPPTVGPAPLMAAG